MVSQSHLRYRIAVFAANDAILTTLGTLAVLSVLFSAHIVFLAVAAQAIILSLSLAASGFSLLQNHIISREKKVPSHSHILVEHKLGLASEHKHAVFHASAVIFFSCLLASAIIIVPFAFVGIELALASSVAIGLTLLLVIGMLKGQLKEDHAYLHGLRQVVFGVLMCVVGYGVGLLLKAFF